MLRKLEEKNKELFQYVKSNIEIIYSKLDNIESTFIEYTDHSSNHSKRIIQIATLLNGENDLNEFELALFILSAYYHDIGMYVSKKEYIQLSSEIIKLPEYPKLKESIYNDEKLVNKDKCDFFITLDYIRNNHGIRTNDFIDKTFPDDKVSSFYSRDYYFWEQVKNISLSHTLDFKQLLSPPYNPKISIGNNNVINLTYLSVLLRLADICHLSKDRALPYFRKTKEFHSKKSESIWEYYADIADTRPDSGTMTIDVYATCKNFYNHRSIIRQSQNIQKELMNCHKILVDSNSEYTLSWKYVNTKNVISGFNSSYEYFESRFRLNYQKITSLLMGERLYRDKLFSIREAMQNAIDSIYVFNKKVPNNGNYIYLNYKYSLTDSDAVLDIFDSGTGMDKEIINDYFLSIGEDSFWYTKRCFSEWGNFKKHNHIIADHGIGTLSYFMIADKIEIFSIYHTNGESCHVLIDNYESDIVFLKTDIKNFPIFKKSEQLPTPWDLRHGTCIRFHLKKALPVKNLLEFLAKHSLRVPYILYLGIFEIHGIYEIEKQLINIWHFRQKLDRHCYSRTRDRFFDTNHFIEIFPDETFEQLFTKYFIPLGEYYENPPRDSSIEENFYSIDDVLNFKININYNNSQGIPCRISQNGILIEDAIDFVIDNVKPDSLFLKAYGFDLDVSGEFQFQLDAERTRVINSEFNITIFEKIIDILDNSYFKLLSRIESSTYFPCGGNFYHGMSDIIFPHPDLSIYFHTNLSSTFDVNNLDGIKNKYAHAFSNLNSAKIYNTGYTKNEAISINDIKARELTDILIIKEYLSEKEIKRSGRDHEKILNSEAKNVIKAIKTIENADSLIYIPLSSKGFMIPLFINFDFKVIQNTKCYKKIRILELNDQSLEKKIKTFDIKQS